MLPAPMPATATAASFRRGLLPERKKLQTRSGALEYVVSGAGQPTIVLLNGAGVTLEGWRALYPMIEQAGTVFAWNRFGVKGSDAPRLRPAAVVTLDHLTRVVGGPALRIRAPARGQASPFVERVADLAEGHRGRRPP